MLLLMNSVTLTYDSPTPSDQPGSHIHWKQLLYIICIVQGLGTICDNQNE